MKLKQASHIIISLLLIVATSGITVHKHYSGGKLFSVSVIGDAKSCCENACPFCEDTAQLFKVGTDFVVSDFNSVDFENPTFIIFENAPLSFLTNEQVDISFVKDEDSPPKTLPNIATLQCFRC